MAETAVNIDDLSQEERLALLEQLWDSLSGDPEAVPFTPAPRAELDHRLDEIDRGDVKAFPGMRWFARFTGSGGDPACLPSCCGGRRSCYLAAIIDEVIAAQS